MEVAKDYRCRIIHDIGGVSLEQSDQFDSLYYTKHEDKLRDHRLFAEHVKGEPDDDRIEDEGQGCKGCNMQGVG